MAQMGIFPSALLHLVPLWAGMWQPWATGSRLRITWPRHKCILKSWRCSAIEMKQSPNFTSVSPWEEKKREGGKLQT